MPSTAMYEELALSLALKAFDSRYRLCLAKAGTADAIDTGRSAIGMCAGEGLARRSCGRLTQVSLSWPLASTA